jgi:hypothetical protein
MLSLAGSPAKAQTVPGSPSAPRSLVKPTGEVRTNKAGTEIPKTDKRAKSIGRGDMLNLLYIAADSEGIPRRLLASLVEVESAGRPCATSYKGARGLTQLMPATAQRFGLTVSPDYDERCHPEKALRVGAVYLRWLIDYFNGDVILALAGYNAGEGAVDKFGRRIPPYKETILYVEKILQLYTGKTGLSLSRSYNPNQSAIYLSRLGVKTRSALTAAVNNTSVPVRSPQQDPAGNNETEDNDEAARSRIEESRISMKDFFYPPDQDQ